MLSKNQEMSLSKFMSKILRHSPKEFGIILDSDGYCSVESLVAAIQKESRWSKISINDIENVVNNCEKQRYERTGVYIRANYGHSAEKINYKEAMPPSILFHGTNTKVSSIILSEGIKPMGRKYVHLSESIDFATLAGKRRGELVILNIHTQSAYTLGVKFFLANNGVWLSDFIPPECIAEHIS
ncbi:RNA 2'-phosphotransferase [Paenibacillus sp. GSMTC-2017]|uniref:RNA 2'-phosphotransferase n=1 Tax=Paenibacillus sp. GSMTC-2017 TaxID=2794350 RepID=UPI0018D68AC2|nr:RNA 2'-phosphotransferase [Paenibacillus sp. GSMTC-2017]MBH5317820.1 RNA 2'-phosphotransferase [Paenibacillus sp. GSMTC-2017]